WTAAGRSLDRSHRFRGLRRQLQPAGLHPGCQPGGEATLHDDSRAGQARDAAVREGRLLLARRAGQAALPTRRGRSGQRGSGRGQRRTADRGPRPDRELMTAREPSQPQDICRVGVLGAGMMGAGIAYVSARAGMRVVLLDTTLELAEKGKGYSGGVLDRELAAGRVDGAQRQAVLDRIETTTSFGDLAGCELVIEAVFEDPVIKAEVTRRAEAVIGETAVYSSNTSTLPISGLAEASSRPSHFIGLHFFSPVDRMPLVEIIKGARTSSETVGSCEHYVRQIGKTAIVVNDSRGFYTSRVFGTYTMEGAALLLEGQDPGVIEAVGVEAGMPVGPLAILDEI